MTGEDPSDALPAHNLVGAHEVRAMLGISRARIYQLLDDDPAFPKPFAKLHGGNIWLASEIAEYAANRRPAGRPRTTDGDTP